MTARTILSAMTVALAMASASAKEPTKVQVWLDTEDYTWDRSNDAICEYARILAEEGIRGHFNLAGYLGRFWVEKGRKDVIEALKPHLVGTQTKYHSYHPTVCEYTDIADYDEAYRIALREESEGVGMLKAALGDRKLMFSVMPGSSSSYVLLDAYADMDIPFFGGIGAIDDDVEGNGHCYYQNQHHIFYNTGVCFDELRSDRCDKIDFDVLLDHAATKKLAVMYAHPHMAVRKRHWDIDNFLKGNNVEFGKWNPPEPLPAEETKRFFERFRAFLRRVKADPRFVFTDCEEMLKAEKPRVKITRADIPAIRASLLKDFGPVSVPASWCVADCFQAAVRLLRGDAEYIPGKVYGFLEKPVGVDRPVKVKAADLKAAAMKISFRRHLPVSYDVGGAKIGPADFLFATLEVLDTGAEEVLVSPREQLGDIAARFPKLARFNHCRPPSWVILWPKFKDQYLSDRLRWQYWTLRY